MVPGLILGGWIAAPYLAWKLRQRWLCFSTNRAVTLGMPCPDGWGDSKEEDDHERWQIAKQLTFRPAVLSKCPRWVSAPLSCIRGAEDLFLGGALAKRRVARGVAAKC